MPRRLQPGQPELRPEPQTLLPRRRELDRIRVKGKHQPEVVYELMDVATERSKFESLITRFETAMRIYHEQNWREAEGMFGQLLAAFPEDGPTQIFLQGALEFMETAPEADWAGVYVRKSKYDTSE